MKEARAGLMLQTNHVPVQRLKFISALTHCVVKAVHLYGPYKPGHLALYSVVAVVGEWKVGGVGGHSLLPWSQ